MEKIELLIIVCLLFTCCYYILQNKENKYWKSYFKELYFKEKDIVDKYIKQAIEDKKELTKKENI